MERKWLRLALSGAFSLCAAAGTAFAEDYPRAVESLTYRIARAPAWDPAASEGHCRLRIFVDDRATVRLHGDQLVVETRSGRRSYDQGSQCNQPLPAEHVENFRVTAERGRGSIVDVRPPNRRNDFTSALTIADPYDGGETYVIDLAWNNPGQPLAMNEPGPYFDEMRACQDRVRGEFISRNRGDAYLEFTGAPARDVVGPNRERIMGEGFARNRFESRRLTYECTLNEQTNRVIASSYDLQGRATTALR